MIPEETQKICSEFRVQVQKMFRILPKIWLERSKTLRLGTFGAIPQRPKQVNFHKKAGIRLRLKTILSPNLPYPTQTTIARYLVD